MMRRTLGLSLTVALVALATVAAAPASTFQVTARQVHATGDQIASAPVVAFLQEARSLDGALPPAGFTIQAQHLRVEIDEADPSIHTGAGVVHPDSTTTASDHTDVSVAGTDVRQGYRWTLWPLPGSPAPIMHVVSNCSVLEDAAETSLTRVPLATKDQAQRPSMQTDTTSSTTWQDCSQAAQVKVAGDFMLSLWAWDAELQDSGGTRALPSGQGQSIGGLGILSQDREVFLFARDATLAIPRLGHSHSLYLADAEIQSTELLVLREATLDQAGKILKAAELRVEGDSMLRVHSAGDLVSGTLSAARHSMSADGQALKTRSSSPRAGFDWLPWAIGMAGLGAVLTPTAVYARRNLVIHRRSTNDPVVAAKVCLLLNDAYGWVHARKPARAEAALRRALVLDPENPELHLVRGLCAAQRGDLEAAGGAHLAAWWRMEVLAKDGHVDSRLRAENAYRLAIVHARTWAQAVGPRRQFAGLQAVKWARLATEYDSSYAAIVAAEPMLRAKNLVQSEKGNVPEWLLP